MIKSIGLDIVATERIEKLLSSKENRFAQKILGEAEQKEYQNRPNKLEYLAGRFAAKEALIKVLGALLKNKPGWHQMQVLNDEDGFPRVALDKDLIDFNRYAVYITISHEKNIAAAVAVLEEVK